MSIYCLNVPSPGRTRYSGPFTLIELLVVMSIISILMAILLPSLVTTKKKSREIACLSNSRSIGLTVQMFAADNDGRIKPSFYDTAVYDIDYVYESNVDNPFIFECPTVNRQRGLYLVFDQEVVRCNYAIFSPFNYAQAFSLDRQSYPLSNVRLVGEAIAPPIGYHWFDQKLCPWNTAAEWRHKGRMNVIFADGSGGPEQPIPSPDSSNPKVPPYLRTNQGE